MSKQLPYLSGETYEAMVPDTLDLAEHAKLAFDAVVSAPVPNFEYAPWWKRGIFDETASSKPRGFCN
jgi:hypothetical protein